MEFAESGTTTTTSDDGTSLLEPQQDLVADQALADEAILAAADLGPGWTSVPSEDNSPEDDALMAELAEAAPECDKLAAADDLSDGLDLLPDAPVRADSDTLAQGAVEVENAIMVFPSADALASRLDAMASLGLAECLRVVFAESIQVGLQEDPEAPDITIDSVTVSEGDGGFGQPSYFIALQVEFSVPTGESASIGIELRGVAVDRVFTGLTIFTGPFGDADGAGIVESSVAKVQNALTG
ncbi:MAG: hypothetical protein KDB21_04705 [Acidimicrobiales bacterium]|nr:hypothetical protein [Acidimicrobiales bacterium]